MSQVVGVIDAGSSDASAEFSADLLTGSSFDFQADSGSLHGDNDYEIEGIDDASLPSIHGQSEHEASMESGATSNESSYSVVSDAVSAGDTKGSRTASDVGSYQSDSFLTNDSKITVPTSSESLLTVAEQSSMTVESASSYTEESDFTIARTDGSDADRSESSLIAAVEAANVKYGVGLSNTEQLARQAANNNARALRAQLRAARRGGHVPVPASPGKFSLC